MPAKRPRGRHPNGGNPNGPSTKRRQVPEPTLPLFDSGEYLARHTTDELTATIDAMIDVLGEESDIDPFVRSASQRVLEKSEW